MFRSNWLIRVSILSLFVPLLFLAGCSNSLKNTAITEENKAQLADQSMKELTVEEARLLRGYLDRTYPNLAGGELPTGRTLGEMINDQRAFEASGSTGTAAEAGSPSEPPPAQASAPSAAESTPAESVSTSPASSPKPRETAPIPETAAPPAAPSAPSAPTTATVPSGTRVQIRLAESVSSKTNETGNTFQAQLDRDLVIDGNLVAPEGSRVVGTLTDVKKSGKVKGKAQMSMTIDKIFVGEEGYPIQANTLSFEASGSTKKDATRIGIATGIGAVVGAIAGGGKGAAIGSAIGAGAGTGVVLATPGENVEFGVETPMEFALRAPVTMKIVRR